MANTKISALTSATTPLAGTEVLPIVQSSATVKVATNDLTVRNIRANATTGILQVTGPTASSTRVMTVPDASFTVAITDAAQSLTGDQTLSTGNLVIGVSGKGIDFSITPNPAGMTSELLADYEEGTFTPSLSGATGYSNQVGTYVKVGKIVHFQIQFTVTSGSPIGVITGLPFTSANTNDSSYSSQISVLTGNTGVTYAVGATQLVGYVNRNDTVAYIQSQGSIAGGSITISSTASLYIAGSYISA